MAVPHPAAPPAPSARSGHARVERWTRPGTVTVVALVVAVAVAVRLPGLDAPLGADEGGFLVVGGQWHAGGSAVYGSYFVDRPPLLIGLFGLAAHLGGAVPLRLIGCLAVALTVAGSAVGGHLLRGRPGALWASATAAALVSSPLLGAPAVNGELLAAPAITGSFVATLLATRDGVRPSVRTASALAGGVLAASAVLVKQNMLDGFVLAVALVAASVLSGRLDRRSGARVLRDGAVGSAGLGVVVLGWAAARGTSPAELWDALVVFRAQAASVIGTSASAATGRRMHHLLEAFALSGAAAVVVALLVGLRRRDGRAPVALALVAVLGWDVVSVLAGGSYWLHYLTQLTPALALVAALGCTAPRPALARVGTVWVVALAAVLSLVGAVRPATPSDPVVAGRWLAAASSPTDTAVVLYGQPGLLATAGLTSPYPQLWSLPVRVRDPELSTFAATLAGPRSPTWVLVRHGRVATWGVDATSAEAVLRARYRPVRDVCGYRVLRRADVPGPVPAAPSSCPNP